MILGPPSVGRPLPSQILPSMSCETGSLTVSPVKRTLVAETSSPDVPSKIWTTATPPPTSRTWPLRSSPLGVLILASSPYPTPRTCSTKIRGPDISRTVLYSRPASETILFRLDSRGGEHFEFLIETFVQRLGIVGELVCWGESHAADIVLDGKFENFLEWYALIDCFLHEVVVVQDCPDHIVGLRLVAVAVGGVVGLLHEEVFLDHLRSLQDDPLSLGESVGTAEHDYLAEVLVALGKIHCHLSEVNPFGPDFFGIPGLESVEVERVACQPVDGWEVAPLGKFGVKGPEDLDDTESILSNRFGKVTAWRGDSADNADGPLFGFRAKDFQSAGSLVEIGESGCKIGWVSFFAGHLF